MGEDRANPNIYTSVHYWWTFLLATHHLSPQLLHIARSAITALEWEESTFKRAFDPWRILCIAFGLLKRWNGIVGTQCSLHIRKD
jgi:hypothetical protein